MQRGPCANERSAPQRESCVRAEDVRTQVGGWGIASGQGRRPLPDQQQPREDLPHSKGAVRPPRRPEGHLRERRLLPHQQPQRQRCMGDPEQRLQDPTRPALGPSTGRLAQGRVGRLGVPGNRGRSMPGERLRPGDSWHPACSRRLRLRSPLAVRRALSILHQLAVRTEHQGREGRCEPTSASSVPGLQG